MCIDPYLLELAETVIDTRAIACIELVDGKKNFLGLHDGLLYLDATQVVMNIGKSLINIEELLQSLRETGSVRAAADQFGVGFAEVLDFVAHQAFLQRVSVSCLLGWKFVAGYWFPVAQEVDLDEYWEADAGVVDPEDAGIAPALMAMQQEVAVAGNDDQEDWSALTSDIPF